MDRSRATTTVWAGRQTGPTNRLGFQAEVGSAAASPPARPHRLGSRVCFDLQRALKRAMPRIDPTCRGRWAAPSRSAGLPMGRDGGRCPSSFRPDVARERQGCDSLAAPQQIPRVPREGRDSLDGSADVRDGSSTPPWKSRSSGCHVALTIDLMASAYEPAAQTVAGSFFSPRRRPQGAATRGGFHAERASLDVVTSWKKGSAHRAPVSHAPWPPGPSWRARAGISSRSSS